MLLLQSFWLRPSSAVVAVCASAHCRVLEVWPPFISLPTCTVMLWAHLAAMCSSFGGGDNMDLHPLMISSLFRDPRSLFSFACFPFLFPCSAPVPENRQKACGCRDRPPALMLGVPRLHKPNFSVRPESDAAAASAREPAVPREGLLSYRHHNPEQGAFPFSVYFVSQRPRHPQLLILSIFLFVRSFFPSRSCFCLFLVFFILFLVFLTFSFYVFLIDVL